MLCAFVRALSRKLCLVFCVVCSSSWAHERANKLGAVHVQEMAARRSPLAGVLVLAATVLGFLSLSFVAPVEVARSAEAVASTASAGPLEALQSSVLTADISPLENPNISFVVLLSMFSMSIALVVWGRNGF